MILLFLTSLILIPKSYAVEKVQICKSLQYFGFSTDMDFSYSFDLEVFSQYSNQSVGNKIIVSNFSFNSSTNLNASEIQFYYGYHGRKTIPCEKSEDSCIALLPDTNIIPVFEIYNTSEQNFTIDNSLNFYVINGTIVDVTAEGCTLTEESKCRNNNDTSLSFNLEACCNKFEYINVPNFNFIDTPTCALFESSVTLSLLVTEGLWVTTYILINEDNIEIKLKETNIIYRNFYFGFNNIKLCETDQNGFQTACVFSGLDFSKNMRLEIIFKLNPHGTEEYGTYIEEMIVGEIFMRDGIALKDEYTPYVSLTNSTGENRECWQSYSAVPFSNVNSELTVCCKEVEENGTIVTTSSTIKSSEITTQFLSTTLPSLNMKAENVVWWIIGAAFLLLVFIALVGIYFLRRRRSHIRYPDNGFNTNSEFSDHKNTINFTQEQFKVKHNLENLNIDFVNVLGKGSSSTVYKGYFKKDISEKNITKNLQVVVKIPISFDKDDTIIFLQELYSHINLGTHPHIIFFYGWTLYHGIPAIIFELAQNDLLHYVKSFRDQQVPIKKFLSILWQICQALEYITSLKMVHRDVACRNILLYENNKIAKIADFGLCCNCNESETYYATSHKKLPLKWVSIEALCDRKFSEKSDVWAFGILCYEMFSLGAEPYPTFTHAEMFEFLQSGKRLAKPKDSTDEIYQLMLTCWKENPADRLCFTEIVETLRKMLESQTAEYGYVPLDDYYKEYYALKFLKDQNLNNAYEAPKQLSNKDAGKLQLNSSCNNVYFDITDHPKPGDDNHSDLQNKTNEEKNETFDVKTFSQILQTILHSQGDVTI